MTEANSVRAWRFWVPLALQSALILAIPGQAIYTQLTGRTITVQASQFNPYSSFQIYYVYLAYDISSPDVLETLPGWQEIAIATDSPETEPSIFQEGIPLYVVLQEPASSTSQPPQPWQPVRVSRDRPTDLANNQVALRGIYKYERVRYGVETYYLPEDTQSELLGESEIRDSNPSIVMEVKVRSDGNGVPVSFWVGDRQYRF